MDFSFVELLLLSLFSNVSEGSRGFQMLATVDIKILCPEHENSTITTIENTRYDENTKRCYLLPTQGPCGANMAFYAKDDIYGECDCNEEERILVYHSKTAKCHYIFTQAYCGKNKWLDFTRRGRPTCVRNPCAATTSRPKSSQFQKDMVSFKGACVEVGKDNKKCPMGQVVGFVKNKRLPTCIPAKLIFTPRAMGVPSTPCLPGSMMGIIGGCSPPFDFD